MRQVSLWDVDDVESFGPVSGIFGGLTPQRREDLAKDRDLARRPPIRGRAVAS